MDSTEIQDVVDGKLQPVGEALLIIRGILDDLVQALIDEEVNREDYAADLDRLESLGRLLS